MKKKIVYLSMLLFTALVLTACREDLSMSPSEAGKQAGIDFCKCMQRADNNDCVKQLNSRYGGYMDSPAFLKELQDNPCGFVFMMTWK